MALASPPVTQAAVTVEPLRCSACGAHLALGQGRSAICPFCRAETPIPEAYGALQRSARSFETDKKLAEQLYGKVGKPPGPIARVVGRGVEKGADVGGTAGAIVLMLAFGNPLIGFPLVMAAAYALGYPVAGIIRAIYWLSRHPHPEPLSAFLVLPIALVGSMVLVALPIIYFGKERALAGVRRDIHASLAAALPERPGGPSRCRNCGGGLDVPSGALGVPCTYCKADNLVALPADWVTRVRSSEFHAFLRIDGALEAFRLASEKAREKMWQLAFAMVLLLPVMFFVAYLLEEVLHIGF